MFACIVQLLGQFIEATELEQLRLAFAAGQLFFGMHTERQEKE